MSRNRIVQRLHDEHVATVTTMEGLENLLLQHRKPPPADTGSRLLREVADRVDTEVSPHFDFEERELFSFLDAMGDTAIGHHLAGEHDAMRPLGRRLAELARGAARDGFTAGAWDEFRQLGLEFSERMLTHIQKEEMALLPLLDETMDAETEARLYDAYVADD